MRGAAAGRFFVGVRSGGSAVPGKEGRSTAAGQKYLRSSENEKTSDRPRMPSRLSRNSYIFNLSRLILGTR